MIDDSIEIEPGLVVRHDPEGGLLYRVDGVIPSSDDYETQHALPGLRRIIYTQLQDGGYPAGSPWDKDERQFRAYFSIETQDQLLGSEFITLVQSGHSDEEIPVITSANLRAFSQSIRGSTQAGERIWNSTVVKAHLVATRVAGSGLAPYFEHNEDGRPIGIKPNKLREIVEYIRSNPGYVRKFGQVSEEVLLALHKQLFPSEVAAK